MGFVCRMEARSSIIWGVALERRLTRCVQIPFASEGQDMPNHAVTGCQDADKCLVSPQETAPNSSTFLSKLVLKRSKNRSQDEQVGKLVDAINHSTSSQAQSPFSHLKR